MSETVCPACGAVNAPDSPAGLCPNCLLGNVLNSAAAELDRGPFAATSPGPGREAPPSVAAVAALFPQLDVECLLGHGGMGAVYRARQANLDRRVAIKIVRSEVAEDPAFAERFAREAKTLARLSHPNIVAIHDFGEVSRESSGDGTPRAPLFYFVMEYVDGASLRQLMQEGLIEPSLALSIVQQICDALQYAHDEGVVHRDIKPENILLDSRGRVKIADFGLAKLVAQPSGVFTLTATHQVMGTPRYMAPEQMEGSRAVDHRADIYSLGVVLYEMLTGEIPAGHFEPPSRRAAVDRRLDDIVLRAMARDPRQRFQSVSELRSDVERISSGNLPYGRVDSDARAGVAGGLSTIIDREAAAAWRLVTGTPSSQAGPRQAQIPTLLMLLLCLCGALSVLLPWMEFHIRDGSSMPVDWSFVGVADPAASRMPQPASDAWIMCQSVEHAEQPSLPDAFRYGGIAGRDIRAGEQITMYGTDQWPGLVMAAVFAVIAFLLIVAPQTAHARPLMPSFLAALTLITIAHIVLFPMEAKRDHVRTFNGSDIFAEAESAADGYRLCLMQEGSFFSGTPDRSLASYSSRIQYREGFFLAAGVSTLVLVLNGLSLRQAISSMSAAVVPAPVPSPMPFRLPGRADRGGLHAVHTPSEAGRPAAFPGGSDSGAGVSAPPQTQGLLVSAAAADSVGSAAADGRGAHIRAGDSELAPFSGKAVLGACLIPVTVIAASMFLFTSVTPERNAAPRIGANPAVLLLVAASLPLLCATVTTILGFVAISDILVARGRLRGLGLAFLDATFFPTILLGGGGALLLMTFARGVIPRTEDHWFVTAMLVILGGIAAAGFLVLRRQWRGLAGTYGDGMKSTGTAPSAAQRPRHRVSQYDRLWDSGDVTTRRNLQRLKTAGLLMRLSAVLGLLNLIGFLIAWVVNAPGSLPVTHAIAMLVLPFLIPGIILTAVIIRASQHLAAVRRYEFCFVGCILTLLPWGGLAWLVSLPAGIWIFHLLQEHPIRDMFLQVEDDSRPTAL